MKRRTFVRNLLVVAGGTAVLPTCRFRDSKASLLLHHISVSAEQEALLAEFTETLLPASDTPGAKDTYTHLYVLRMIDDCSEKEEQEIFLQGLQAVENETQQHFGTSFTVASPAQRSILLGKLEAGKAAAGAQAFYQLVKPLAIRGYLTSKPVMGDILHYELVPGRYLPAVSVNTVSLKA